MKTEKGFNPSCSEFIIRVYPDTRKGNTKKDIMHEIQENAALYDVEIDELKDGSLRIEAPSYENRLCRTLELYAQILVLRGVDVRDLSDGYNPLYEFVPGEDEHE